ncbi:MAG TPA: cupredoxin domain-containing protein [Gemmatimonadaceae bacterium]|nr:cupredoxin domain-containing protein [Gemmatimonadaceae bacterium]
MTGIEWLVVLGAAGAIAWVNWYFFVAGRAVATAAPAPTGTGGAAGVQRVAITVDGGYSPNTVRVKAGQPVQLVFDRKDTSSCSEEIVFPDFGVRRFLPTGKETVIEVTPAKPGRYEFMCGMSMLRGSLVAEE